MTNPCTGQSHAYTRGEEACKRTGRAQSPCISRTSCNGDTYNKKLEVACERKRQRKGECLPCLFSTVLAALGDRGTREAISCSGRPLREKLSLKPAASWGFIVTCTTISSPSLSYVDSVHIFCAPPNAWWIRLFLFCDRRQHHFCAYRASHSAQTLHA